MMSLLVPEEQRAMTAVNLMFGQQLSLLIADAQLIQPRVGPAEQRPHQLEPPNLPEVPEAPVSLALPAPEVAEVPVQALLQTALPVTTLSVRLAAQPRQLRPEGEMEEREETTGWAELTVH